MWSFPEKNGLWYEVVSPLFGPHIGTNADFIGLRQKGANLSFQLDQKFLYLLSNQCLTRDSVATVKWSESHKTRHCLTVLYGTFEVQTEITSFLVRPQFIDY